MYMYNSIKESKGEPDKFKVSGKDVEPWVYNLL